MPTSSPLLIVGNWKMNLNPEGSGLLARHIHKGVGSGIKGVELVLAPSFVGLIPVSEAIPISKIGLAAQNVSHEEEGPRTGEIAATQVKGLVQYVIVGHSERRIHLHERDSVIAQKLAAVHRAELTPILCVGETLHEKEDGMAARVVNDQMQSALRDLDPEEITKTVIAYEPVWAIGTGNACSPTYAESVIDGLRRSIELVYGKPKAKQVRFLYGGSVSSKNIRSYTSVPGIDGALVGGASLEADEFVALCKAAVA